MGTEAPVLRTLPDFTLHTSSAGCSSVSLVINQETLVNVSLRFVSYSSKLSNLRTGSWEALVCSKVRWKGR